MKKARRNKQQSNIVEMNTEQNDREAMMINSFSSALARLDGQIFGKTEKRDYNQIFGYGVNLSYRSYYTMYKRSAVGGCVVDKFPAACWNGIPTIKSGEKSILEKELKQLAKVGFFAALKRADRLNRIGKFSCLLIGVGDGLELTKPVGSAKNSSFKQLYFNPYNYDGVEIVKYDTDPASDRYNLPVEYQFQTTFLDDRIKDTTHRSVNAHWSRVVLLAEGALDSSIEGMSALEQPYNSLIDLEKIRGGAGEAYFKNARQQRAIEANKDATIASNPEALKKLKDNIDNFDNAWDSTLRLQNMSVKNLPITMITPRDSYDVAIESVSAVTGMPIRILSGKGAGQLAGSEDRATWNALVSDRRVDFCDLILMNALEILESASMIELPDDSIIEWPEQSATSDTEKANINKTKSETLKNAIEVISGIGGAAVKSKSVFESLGLDEVEVVKGALDDFEPEPEQEE